MYRAYKARHTTQSKNLIISVCEDRKDILLFTHFNSSYCECLFTIESHRWHSERRYLGFIWDSWFLTLWVAARADFSSCCSTGRKCVHGSDFFCFYFLKERTQGHIILFAMTWTFGRWRAKRTCNFGCLCILSSKHSHTYAFMPLRIPATRWVSGFVLTFPRLRVTTQGSVVFKRILKLKASRVGSSLHCAFHYVNTYGATFGFRRSHGRLSRWLWRVSFDGRQAISSRCCVIIENDGFLVIKKYTSMHMSRTHVCRWKWLQ